MDPNLCDVNHLDGDVILPPRKRLLAGLRSQHSPDSTEGPLHLSLSASPSGPTFTPPSSPSPSSSFEFNTRLRSLLISHHNKDLSPGEIAEASRSAAVAATRAARAARAAAEERAEAAALAMASAKRALELSASLSEETADRQQRSTTRKNKKHVPVQLLYRKNGPVENCGKDEEMARRLHRAINSSPRITTKNSSGSDSKEDKDRRRKKPKSSNGTSERTNKDSLGEGLVSEPNSNGHVAVQVDVLDFV